MAVVHRNISKIITSLLIEILQKTWAKIPKVFISFKITGAVKPWSFSSRFKLKLSLNQFKKNLIILCASFDTHSLLQQELISLHFYLQLQILQGLHDSHGDIVTATLIALSHLVPILSAGVVIGTERRDIFSESHIGKQRGSSTLPVSTGTRY